MDKAKSKFEIKHSCYWIENLKLDKNVLNDIPLKKRLIFCLEEAPGYTLFHKSVVDAIVAMEPTGMYFQNVEEYDDF